MLIGKLPFNCVLLELKINYNFPVLRVNKSKEREKFSRTVSSNQGHLIQENYILVTTFVVVMAHKTS